MQQKVKGDHRAGGALALVDGQFVGVRKFPQELREHTGVGASRQEKTPTENVWGFGIGGAGGNRTRVRKPSTGSSTYLVR